METKKTQIYNLVILDKSGSMQSIRKEAIERGIECTLEEGESVNQLGICALVNVENMGFCKDDITRWYHFTNNAGEACIYIKH